MANTKTNMALDVPTWANNANKKAQVRKVLEARKKARERKHARNVALLVAFYAILIVLYGWLNNIG